MHPERREREAGRSQGDSAARIPLRHHLDTSEAQPAVHGVNERPEHRRGEIVQDKMPRFRACRPSKHSYETSDGEPGRFKEEMIQYCGSQREAALPIREHLTMTRDISGCRAGVGGQAATGF